MRYRDWILIAFILAAIMGVSAMWLADVKAKSQSAESSMTGIKAALTPFERDRREAVEKIERVYGGGK